MWPQNPCSTQMWVEGTDNSFPAGSCGFWGFFSFFLNWFIYLATLGLGCSMWDRRFPGSGTEPASPALGEQSFNHWTTREVPRQLCFNAIFSVSLLACCGLRSASPQNPQGPRWNHWRNFTITNFFEGHQVFLVGLIDTLEEKSIVRTIRLPSLPSDSSQGIKTCALVCLTLGFFLHGSGCFSRFLPRIHQVQPFLNMPSDWQCSQQPWRTDGNHEWPPWICHCTLQVSIT